MNNKIKVAYLIPSFEIYGAQKISIDYFLKLIRSGYDVTFLSGGKGPLFNNTLNKNTIFFGRKEISKFKFFRIMIDVYNLFYIIRNNNFDLIISIAPLLNRIICIFKFLKIYKKKLIIEDHAFPPVSNYDEFKSFYTRFFIFKTEFLYIFADNLKVLTEECKAYYRSKLGKKVNIFVLPNFIDFKRIDHSIKSNKIKIYKDHNTFRLVYIARLTSQKNIFFIIDAFKILSNKFKCELIIIGDGPLKKDLKEYVKNLNLTKNVIFKFSSTRNYSILKSADVFPIASKWEGLVLTAIEAMYLKVPIVSTNFKAGMSFLIGKNNLRGFLSPINDLNKFTDNLEYVLLNKKKLKIKKKVNLAQSFVLNNLSLKMNFNKYLKNMILFK